jgi:hypothetical protein
VSAASAGGIRSKNGSLISLSPREIERWKTDRGGTHPERDRWRNCHIMAGRDDDIDSWGKGR